MQFATSIRHAQRLAAGITLLLSFRSAGAQAADSSCAYERCALNIMPRLSALDVVRGSSEDRVGSLAFLFPHSVNAAFRGSDTAQLHASRAYRLRRVAAGLTDVGILMGAAATTRVVPSSRRGIAVSVAFAMVASSVPIHFAADAALSRAVWAYNRQFSR